MPYKASGDVVYVIYRDDIPYRVFPDLETAAWYIKSQNSSSRSRLTVWPARLVGDKAVRPYGGTTSD